MNLCTICKRCIQPDGSSRWNTWKSSLLLLLLLLLLLMCGILRISTAIIGAVDTSLQFHGIVCLITAQNEKWNDTESGLDFDRHLVRKYCYSFESPFPNFLPKAFHVFNTYPKINFSLYSDGSFWRVSESVRHVLLLLRWLKIQEKVVQFHYQFIL